MTPSDLIERFAALPPSETAIVATLALVGEFFDKSRLVKYLRHARIKSSKGVLFNIDSLSLVLNDLLKTSQVLTKDLRCVPDLVVTALQTAKRLGIFDSIFDAVLVAEDINASSLQIYTNNYRLLVMLLRMVMLRGMPLQTVKLRVQSCATSYQFRHIHPFVEIFARPFDPAFFAMLHPDVQQYVMVTLLLDCQNYLPNVPVVRDAAQKLLAAPGDHDIAFINALAEHYLLCGQFSQAVTLIGPRSDAIGQVMRSVALLCSGDLRGGIDGIDVALKLQRQAMAKRTFVFEGLYGLMYVLALLHVNDADHLKKSQTYLDLVMRLPDGGQSGFAKLKDLSQVQSGLRQISELENLPLPNTVLAQLLYFLVDYWLDIPISADKIRLLVLLYQQTQQAGLLFLAAQAAELLGRIIDSTDSTDSTDSAQYLESAKAMRQEYCMVCMVSWFERQETWQRQLAALAGLIPGAKQSATGQSQTRLVWQLYLVDQFVSLSPYEQKRKGTGAWSSGRAAALKRLCEDASTMDFLTPQDQQICAGIRKVRAGYYGGINYELDDNAALNDLIGHPAVFWRDMPNVRVEILRGEPELEIKKTSADTLTLRLQPSLEDVKSGVVITKETPTRLRVIAVTDEHRHIAAILGKSLKVPARAKEQVLDAIRSISSLITIQSDIDVLPSNAEQVEADSRLHVHLMPYGAGLKLHILVRPFANDGPYYTPGAGSESVIAEIAGKPLQARRNLTSEVRAAKKLVASCPALRDAVENHGERTVEEPEDCLELLLQLQDPSNKVVIAWPEGEKFRVSRAMDTSRFSMSIKRHLDWFAASGELKLDDDSVMDLMKLLNLTAEAKGRFIPLGDNQFLTLTEEFRRRLDDLRALSDRHGNEVRVHTLAASALEDLAGAAATLKADKHWKEHLVRLRELDKLQPTLPGTLQADLRDYQLSGFNWLSRLAHWGVGACLADDMGLGKTLQALALLLSRAPEGPALVVAPTSVCTNWISEIGRFAPSLRVILFGAGNRQLTLTDLQPLDVVIASYGLLQQETERFGAIQWHTIVLDEAQAIKNHQTKRSQAAMALQGNFRMICSGTPLENHLGELWNLFRFINPGLLGSLEQFNERYANPIERLQDANARNRLRRLIQPFILRRTKSQVLSELPSRTEILRQVELSTEETALYEALRLQALERLSNTDANDGQRHIQILAEIMKLRRACCNPQLVAPALGLPSSKLAAFGELLDELLSNHHKALVFSQFVDHLGLIRTYLDEHGIRYQYLDGSTPMQERKVRVDAFQAGEGDVFLISLKAGGTGLNLTAADYVIHMDPWWNPAVEDQASDRAHRIGQTRPVTIYRLVAKMTIEEKIVDLHQHKRALADSLLEGSDLSAKLSADDMMLLLQEDRLTP